MIKRMIPGVRLLATLTGIVLFLYIYTPSGLSTSIPHIENHRKQSNLAPELATARTDLRERFLEGEALLSHRALNAYIRSAIEDRLMPEKGSRWDIWISERVNDGSIPIPGLLAEAGTPAHVGLGRAYGRPVIYIDADLYNVERDRRIILRHESDEIEKWERLRRALGKDWKQMREWILQWIDTPDPDLRDSYFAGLSSRRIAEKIHADAASLNTLYEKYADRIRIREDYIAALMTRYGDRPEDSVFYDPAASPDVPITAAVPQGVIPAEAPSYRAHRAAAGKSWIEQNMPALAGKTILTLSVEGNVPNFAGYRAQDANTKGGLGAYAGDKKEALHDIGMKAVAIQPGYSHIMKDGRKEEVRYKKLMDDGILRPVFVNGESLWVRAWDEEPGRSEEDEDAVNPRIRVNVYEVDVGGTRTYIVMSDVFDILYADENSHPGNHRAHRFMQEIVYGKACYELTKKLGLVPDILHLNEAHTVVAAALMRADEQYDRMSIVYTVHTNVPAGLETFYPQSLRTNINRMVYSLVPESRKAHSKKAEDAARRISRIRSGFYRQDGVVDFCREAIGLADVINAVSDEHAIAATNLFKSMYGDWFDKPIIGVLNGSGKSWKAKELRGAEEAGVIPTEDVLWEIHERSRFVALAEIERRTRPKGRQDEAGTGTILDPNKPTAWAVRRIVDYKSQYPILRFLVHLMTAERSVTFTRDELRRLWLTDIPDLSAGYNEGMVNSALDKIFRENSETIDSGGVKTEVVRGLGMQMVVGGPAYMDFWVEEFRRWSTEERMPSGTSFKGKFVFVQASDAELLRMQAIGADICITMPRPLEEACGTSDQRTALNGGVNIAIRGAGPKEWMTDYDDGDGSGFFIGDYLKPGTMEADMSKFYHEAPADIFSRLRIASGIYYGKEHDGKRVNSEWKHLMHNSYMAATYGWFIRKDGTKVATKAVTAEAMEQRYAARVYLPAIEKRCGISEGIEEAIRLFSSDNTVKVLEEGGRYEIRYNSVTIAGCPYAKEILEGLVRLLKMRAKDPGAIKLIGSNESPLISVTRYVKGEIAGRGDVDVADQGSLKDARLIDMFNMAFAAANITSGRPYSDMDEYEKSLIKFIISRYRALAGEDKDENSVLEAIKRLPRMLSLPLDDMEHNRLALEKLQQSA